MRSDVTLLRRFAAILYDGLLLFSLIFVVFGIIVVLTNKAQTNAIFFYTLTLPLGYFYFAFSWIKGGQTLGMKAWHFKIISANTGKITHKQVLIRLILSIFSLLFLGLGFFYQCFNKNKLTLHDKHSDTLLLKKII